MPAVRAPTRRPPNGGPSVIALEPLILVHYRATRNFKLEARS